MSDLAESEPGQDGSGLTLHSIAVGCITLTRYLRSKDPDLPLYLASALAQAKEAGLSDSDLSLLKLMLRTIK